MALVSWPSGSNGKISESLGAGRSAHPPKLPWEQPGIRQEDLTPLSVKLLKGPNSQ